MSIKSQILRSIWIIIGLLSFKISAENIEIEYVEPKNIKIDRTQTNTTLILRFKGIIPNRNQTKLQLMSKDKKIPTRNYSAAINQDQLTDSKVYFELTNNDFIDNLSKYYLSFYLNDTERIDFNETILIYENEIELKNPTKRYFLSNDTRQENNSNRTTYFSFLYPIILEEIHKIEYYPETDTNSIKNLDLNYCKLEEEGKKLIVTLDEAKFDFNNVNSYTFNIYPEYAKDTSIEELHQFYIYFFDYFLLTDAIYIRNGTSLSSFNIYFTTKSVSNLFSIVDKSKSLHSCHPFNCSKSGGNTFKCNCTLSIDSKVPNDIFTIKYNSEQETQIYLFTYQTNIQKCYFYGQSIVPELNLTVYLGNFEYWHEVFFSGSRTGPSKLSLYPINYNQKKYYINFPSLEVDDYTIYSAISILGDNHNFIDEESLDLHIYPQNNSFLAEKSFVYYNNGTEQKFIINSSYSTNVLDQIKLKNMNKSEVEITLSKDKECQAYEKQFSCKLENLEAKHDGVYNIFYKNKCGNETEISGRTVTIRQGFSLLSLSPEWINKTISNISKLTLHYNTDLSFYVNSGLKIKLYDKEDNKPVYEYNKSDELNSIPGSNDIILSLRDTEEGEYYVETTVEENGSDNGTRIDKNENLTFIVNSPSVIFTFDHHYFVLRDNDERNYLKITVDDSENEFGCKIVEESDNEVLSHEQNNCTEFKYPIKKTGTIKFNYYYKNKTKMPINDYIIVEQSYSYYFQLNHKNCYYYEFDLSLTTREQYTNIQIFAFLQNEEKNETINITREENSYKYEVIVPLKENKYSNAYYLYITESFVDTKGAYLYRSNELVNITDLTPPLYAINPYLPIIFDGVKCNLTDSNLIIQKDNSNFGMSQFKLDGCKYISEDEKLNCSLPTNFYKLGLYQSFSYSIDDKKIKNFTTSETLNTFISNRLSDSSFKIDSDVNENLNMLIVISNTNKDFYFPLLQNLTTYLVKDGKNISCVYEKNKNESLSINENNFTVTLKVNHGFNFVLDINNLKRNITPYDSNDFDLSLYHYFNEGEGRFIENFFFTISPTIFAFNKISKDDSFNITIEYKNETYLNQYNQFTNLKCDDTYDDNKRNCLVNVNTSKGAQNIIVSVNNSKGEKSETLIKFIHYSLPIDNKFTVCVTKTEDIGNLSLYIDFPDNDLVNITYLYNSYLEQINSKKIDETRIIYYLNGNQINLDNTYYILRIINDTIEFTHYFELTGIGLKMLPKYDIKFTGDIKMSYLLPENNQSLTINIEKNEGLYNQSDIEDIILVNNDYNFSSYSIMKRNQMITASFNLTNANKYKNKTYTLQYKDKCNKYINTDAYVEIAYFQFERHYFVLNNNNNQSQKLIIHGPNFTSGSLRVKINGDYNQDINDNNYTLDIKSAGIYTFELKSESISSQINDTVYVVDNLEDLLKIENPPSECYYSNSNGSDIKNITFSISSISSKLPNLSIIDSEFTTDKINFYNLTPSISNPKTFTFSPIENKEKMDLGHESYIFITENSKTDQPLYVYKFNFTDIQLLIPDEVPVIYTDTEFILFNMKCQITNFRTFNFKNSTNNKNFPMTCQDLKPERKNVYKCLLSENDNSTNSLLNVGNDESDYGIYNIYYDNYELKNSSFYLSHEIVAANFSLEKKKEINDGDNTTITIQTYKPNFYLPAIEYLSFIDINNDNSAQNASGIKIINEYNNLTAKLKVVRGNRYALKKICRKNCTCCRHDHCKNLDLDYLIYVTTRDVTFSINKHFIALKDSNSTDGSNITSVKITLIGEKSELELINGIIYEYTNLTKYSSNTTINKTDNDNSGEYELNLSKIGRYIFYYITNEDNIFLIRNEVVLVSTYDYEIFDYSSLKKDCLYYDSEVGLIVSIKKNISYDFSSNVDETKINILLQKIYIFSYQTTERTYKYTGEGSFIDYLDTSLDASLVENIESKFYFTKLQNLYLTNFTISYLSNDAFYYKDNIVLKNQYCYLDNILISLVIDEIGSRTYHKLINCNYTKKDKISYCETNYTFIDNYNKTFDIFVGKKSSEENPVDVTKKTNKVNIYNSIKDAEFHISITSENIKIFSSNFDLDKVNNIQINDKNISTKSNIQNENSNSITIQNDLNYSNINTLKKIYRKDHKEDQSSTSKYKDINYTLEIQTCKGEIKIDGERVECLTCNEYYHTVDLISKKYYYQEGKGCVVKCDWGEKCSGYCVYKGEYTCTTADFKTKEGDECICGCSKGTVQLNGICYLPEDDLIIKDVVLDSDLQCRIGQSYNYCNNNTNYTQDCVPDGSSGYSIPKCICRDGITGKYCEFEKNNINLNTSLEKIINNKNGYFTNDINVIATIRGINYILENDENDENYNNIDENYRDLYINYTKMKIQRIKDNKENATKSIYDALDLCIYFMKKKIQYKSINNRLRELADTTEDDLQDLLKYVHPLHKLSTNKIIGGSYNIQSSQLNQISFITYKIDQLNAASFKTSIRNTTVRLLGYLDVKINQTKETDKTKEDDEYLLVTIVNRKLVDDKEGAIVYFSISDIKNLNIEYPFNFYITPVGNFNFNLARYYKIKGINIYNKNDKAFSDRCFISENFDFDLTQKYRKNNVFQKKSSSSPKCIYEDFDIDTNTIKFKCNEFENITDDDGQYGILTYVSNNDTIDKANKVYNLPMLCANKIKNISTNYGFWTFLVLIIIEIIYCVAIQILALGSLRNLSINKGCRNDEFYYGLNVNVNSPVDILVTDNSKNETLQKPPQSEKPNNIVPNPANQNKFKYQYEKKREKKNEIIKNNLTQLKLYTFGECLKRNLKELHPIASLCRVSIIMPLIMNSWFFIFNTVNLFGFNALIYLERTIEKRIYNKNRDNFAYPMRKEFGKIILSILLQVVLAVIFRFIALITLNERNILFEKIKKCKDIYEASLKVSYFEKKTLLRRLITGILMLIIYIFFFYYCVVFCGIYVNTQRNWFFSGVWSLFWNWCVFSPIYIVVISFLEAKERDGYTPLIYYMKKLFCF